MKNLLGHTLFGSRLETVLLRKAAVVVAFHRVHETTDRNGLSVDVGMFERYCRFFQRHFRVVSLRHIVERLERGLEPNRELAVTFDDGYRDNYDYAMPVLQKLSMPATFFVVTQWIGSNVVPRWDARRGVRHPWMTWEQVRSLHRNGFDVGAHTRTHVDLGRASRAEAHEEILGGRLELESQLGAPVESFAYPYGGRNNITNASRDVVKAARFRCCCSGFGGINVQGTDPFHLLRVPISPWYTSPHQFGFDVALGRSDLSA